MTSIAERKAQVDTKIERTQKHVAEVEHELEPGVCESASLTETLHELTASVENTVKALTPLLRDTP
jgi:hypothetical protein